MKQSFSARVIIPDGVLARDVAEELVILNLNNEQYYGLDEIGARLWAVLTASDSIQDGINLLLEEFDVSRETLERDVSHLLADLAEQGLVEFHDQ